MSRDYGCYYVECFAGVNSTNRRFISECGITNTIVCLNHAELLLAARGQDGRCV